jgi:hypothetical protein
MQDSHGNWRLLRAIDPKGVWNRGHFGRGPEASGHRCVGGVENASDIENGLDGVRRFINQIVPEEKPAGILGFGVDIDRFVVGLERIR